MHYLTPEDHQKAVSRYLKNMDRTIEAMLRRREKEREQLAHERGEIYSPVEHREPEMA